MGLSLYGHLCLLAWALAVPGMVPAHRAPWVLATVVLVSWLAGTRRWPSLRDWRAWLFLGGLILAAGLAGGGRGLALAMAARALAVLVAVDSLGGHVSIGEIAGLCEGLGLRGLGFALGVAFNMLPVLRRTAAGVWVALRLRGGLGRRPGRALYRAAFTVLALTLARGQEIVGAAEARAFSPAAAAGALPRPRRADLALGLGLAVWGVVLAVA